MKKFLVVLIGYITLLTLNSCISASYAQSYYEEEAYVEDGITDVTYSIVVTNGTPFYINGIISYYLYNGIYYYPYRWNNYWYLRPYHCAMPHGFIYRPHRGHKPNIQLGNYTHMHSRNFNSGRPHIPRNNKPLTRPSTMPPNRHFDRPNSRPSTRSNTNQPTLHNDPNKGHFGGRR